MSKINKREWKQLNWSLEYLKKFGIDPLLDLKTLPTVPVNHCYLDIPCTPAFYFFIESDKVLYLGKTKNLKQRVRQHLGYQKGNRREKLLKPNVFLSWLSIKSFELLITAEFVEIYFMSRFYPLYNLDYNIYKPCPLMTMQLSKK